MGSNNGNGSRNGKKPRLELTWIGKDKRPRLEPRILLPQDELSYHAQTKRNGDIFDNVLLHADNLLGLKALEEKFTGKVKCVFIDPPYNTGSAFAHYDDGVEHSLWLTLMRDRLELLRQFLTDDGILFIQLDDNEGHYGKVLCDEVFGRRNFIATFIWRKVDSPNDNKVAVTPDHEFIFAYAKNINLADLKQQAADDILEAYRGPDTQGLYYRDRLLKKNGKNSLRTDRPSMWFPVRGPDSRDVYPIHDDGREACWALGKDKVDDLLKADAIIWKNRGTDIEPQWVPYTREYAPTNPSRPYFTIWNDLHTTRQTKAHQKQLFGSGNEFATPKPEDLIERLLRLATNEEDLVLDSFAGSGTTGAVAHKLRRRWIMVESGDHCHTHIIPRLKKVIDGQDSGGITDAVGWKGGGGFRCYRLAPSLIEISEYGFEIISRKYNPAMLSEAMCKHMGYTYAPSPNPEEFWKHGYSSERDFIYVTSASIPRDAIEMLADLVGKGRSLLVCCKAFRLETSILRTLTLKKIPNCILENCEWGRDDYSLKIAALPEVDDGNDPDDGNDDGGDEPQSPPGSRRQGTDTGLELRRGAAATRSAKANGKGTARKAGSAKAKPPAAAPSKRAKAKPKAGTPVAAKTRTPAKAAKGKNTAIARSRHRYDDERQGRLL